AASKRSRISRVRFRRSGLSLRVWGLSQTLRAGPSSRRRWRATSATSTSSSASSLRRAIRCPSESGGVGEWSGGEFIIGRAAKDWQERLLIQRRKVGSWRRDPVGGSGKNIGDDDGRKAGRKGP